jgi:fatty acid desaturase
MFEQVGLAPAGTFQVSNSVRGASSSASSPSTEFSSTTPELGSALDAKGFSAEVEALRREAFATLGSQDLAHLVRTERVGRLASLVGYLTAWIAPNPISAFCLSLGICTRWLMAHHILHKGYDRVPGVPARYTSKYFARGWRRFIDWFDWIHPTAWDHEHNTLHHYNTGEEADPDVVERYLEYLRALKIPYFVKRTFIALTAMTWKFTYYAPNTTSVLDPTFRKRLRHEHIGFISFKNIFDFRNKSVRALWARCYLPYASFNFVLVPLLFSPLGEWAVLSVFLNRLLAEVFANVHSFLVVAPNHSADDLYRFDFHYQGKEQFYVTQVLGSANYHCGTEFTDYMSIWLNYQIEHHLFPDLPMTKYREIQPKVEALCEKYGLPYVQESIWKRVGRLVDVCIGKTTMKRLSAFPRSLEGANPMFP